MKERILKPCPFCGSAAVLTSFRYHPTEDTKRMMPWKNFFSVECVTCHAVNGGRIGFSTETQAAKAWNTRAGAMQESVYLRNQSESEALAELDKLKKYQWISVKDRLPCEQETVLIFDGTIQVDRLVDDDDYPGWQWEYNFANPGVTHWMPLPEVPVASNNSFNWTAKT